MPIRLNKPKPNPATLADRIFAARKDRHKPRHSRRLGASGAGKECERAVWYGFRWAKMADFGGRMLRLFERGDLEEPRLIEDLTLLGARVEEIDPDTGRQWTYNFGPHTIVKVDGIVYDLPEGPEGSYPPVMVAEFKSANAKQFKIAKDKGIKEWRFYYWAQLQLGMLAAGIEHGLFGVACKDDDDLYWERIDLDREGAERLAKRAQRVRESQSPPPKIAEDASNWKCRFCDYKALCHKTELPDVNCRTCAYAHAVDGEGDVWHCAKHETDLPLEVIKKGCDGHVYLEGMVQADFVEESPEGGAIYKSGKGVEFIDKGLTKDFPPL